MKQFFKYVCATVVGIILVVVIITILSIMGLVGMASMGSVTANVKDNSVLVIQLEGSISERSEENPFGNLLGNAALTDQGRRKASSSWHTATSTHRGLTIFALLPTLSLSIRRVSSSGLV